jgi:hypothetical protein
MNMIEKVAAAVTEVWDSYPEPITLENVGEVRLAGARAAIEAMREPTDAMNHRGNVCCMDDCVDRDGVKKVWRSMIDAALG